MTYVGHVRCQNTQKYTKKNDILDVEAWDKLREYRIDGLILWYEVI